LGGALHSSEEFRDPRPLETRTHYRLVRPPVKPKNISKRPDRD
jgi:hypothetical protein